MTELVAPEPAAPRITVLPRFASDVLLGLRLFVPYRLRSDFSGDLAALALAVAMLLGVVFLASFLAVIVEGDRAEFYRWGLYTVLTTLFVQTAVLFLASLPSRGAPLARSLTALAVIETVRMAVAPVLEFAESSILDHAWRFACLAVLLRAVVRELDGPLVRRLAVAGVTGIALWGTTQLVRPFPLFNPVSDLRHPPLNIEETYLKQDRLVAEALDAVLPSLPDTEDTYFVGFAPYAAQNVCSRTK